MRLLIKTALQNRKHYVLLFFAIILMLLATVANQMEMFSLGILTQRGASKEFLDGEKANILRSAIVFLNENFRIYDNVYNLLSLLFVVALFKAVTAFGNKYLAQLVATRVSRDLRQKYFQHIQEMSMSFYQKYNIGSLSTRVVGDAGQVASSINSILINYVHTPFTAVSTLMICFYLSFKLSLIIFFGLPLIVIPMIAIAKRIKRIAKSQQKNQESLASVLIDFLAGIQTVKVFAMERFSLSKYSKQNNRMAVLEEKSARYSFAASPIIHMIATIFLVVIALYALHVEMMTLPEILVYCAMLHVFYEPVKKFAEENNSIQRGVAAAERMFEVLDIEPGIQDHDGAIDMQGLEEGIEFDDVWFKYEDTWILKGVSFKVKKGEFVALVGPTGAGKSTIAQLLPRLYEVQKGEIRIDGKPLAMYTQKSLREHIAFVPQKPFLFFDTIKENIAFGRGFSSEEIKKASRRAHADEFICALPNSYNTMLSEAGKNLSGGQQQRLAIARALVKKAPILIMDEPTSALDAISESRIKSAFKEIHGDITQILIAHRLTTIEQADKIIYLEDGKKVDEGSKDELIKT